jgi:hypothetical protein
MLEIPVAPENQKDFDRTFQLLVNHEDGNLAIKFLEHGISSKLLNPNLKTAVRKNLNQLALKIMDLGGDFSVNSKQGLANSLLFVAIRHQNSDIAEEILARDPKYISREGDKHESLFNAAAGITNLEERNKWLELLFKNGLNTSAFNNEGIHALVTAVMQSDIFLLSTLIKHGANPHQLIGGRSLLEIAKREDNASSTEIIAILKNAGAAENGLELAKQHREPESLKNCSIDNAGYDYSLAANNLKLRAQSAPKTAKPMQRCEAMISSCTKTGLGIDRCIKSVPVCGSSPNKATDIYCCGSSLKTNYLAARCAGLHPGAALDRIDGLKTQYGIPIILLNER